MVFDTIEGTAIKTFKHSGARGDIIYSLPTVIAMGGGVLKINRNGNHYFSLPVGDEEMSGILEFLRTQSYFQAVEEWDGNPCDCELDIFRLKDIRINLLTVAMLNSFGVEFDLRKPWIEVDKIPIISRAEIVISRTSRYHAFLFPWRALSGWVDKAVFIGSESEYQEFKTKTGLNVGWEKPRSWMEMAGIIRGSKLFVGNQSFPYSLAEGMKCARVLEECEYCPNCHPQSVNGHVRLSQPVIRKYLCGEPYEETPVSKYLEEKMKMGQRRW